LILQLNPPIPVRTPRGPGLAHLVIDYGEEHDLLWTVFQNDTGESWTWNNVDIRGQKNVTLGREHISPYYDPNDVAFTKDDSNPPHHSQRE
jgi:hypothetical protein